MVWYTRGKKDRIYADGDWFATTEFQMPVPINMEKPK